MLQITIPGRELFDESLGERGRFVTTTQVDLTLEHSLVSLSKWEQKWEKPFLGKEPRTTDETIDYIRCMTLTENVPPEYFNGLSQENFNQVSAYINAKMTATWFKETAARSNPEVVTSEIIYYWLIALQIDFRVEEWHLNRLLTLVRVVNIKNDPNKKMMPQSEAAAQQRDLNAERRAKYNTEG